MSIISAIIPAVRDFLIARLTAPAVPESRRGWSPTSSAGVHVDEDVALRYAAVWICCRVIAEAISAMPWNVMQRDGNKRSRIQGHPADWLLHVAPNSELSAYTFRETMLFWALTWGNGYAEIERDGSLRPVALWPIEPDRVEPQRDATGALVYEARNSGTGRAFIPARDMFHLRGPGWNGLKGYSPIDLARESIGLGLACQKFGGAFFGNGATPGGVIEAPSTLELSPEAKRILLDEWNKVHRGPGKYGKVTYLDGGMTYKPISIAPNSAQFLETRQHQVLEIARWYKVPPHKIYELTRATYNNVEQHQIEFLTETLVPWIVRLEQEADAKLLGPYQRSRLYTKIKPEALLRGDIKTRYEAYALGRQWGWLSINDVRGLEDMDPIPAGGDEYLTPLNMREAGGQLQPPEPQAQLAALEERLQRLLALAHEQRQQPVNLNLAQGGTTVQVDHHWPAPVAAEIRPEIRVETPVAINVEAPVPQPAEVTIHNLQAPPSIEVKPNIHIEAPPATPAPDVRIEAPVAVTVEAPAPQPAEVVVNVATSTPEVRIDAPVAINVEAPPAPEVTVNVEASPTPEIHVETPVAINVEAPVPQPAEVTIQNLQATPSIEVRPNIHVEAPPAPDVVLQVGEQINDPAQSVPD
ncbi:MAG: phage portal protein [Dokdonella sp.]|uniref:phage portal protein n=1 Tax=Dokdonella sp. TaxID=2291710 RepID=UPI0025C6C085|nr:phage portal protein [Dokdonella sp.]MBK8123930.1 phage portal protein [Dokdonella sp.]